MTNEHLHPDRGWTLLRDGRQFTPAELEHLEDCEECIECLRLFADLALNADLHFHVDAAFMMEVEEHVRPERGLALVRDGEALQSAELAHLMRCHLCHAWLSGLASIARKAGFSIAFEIPSLDIDATRLGRL